MYILVKQKNNIYKLENTLQTKNVKNYIKLNIRDSISKSIVLMILKYKINVLNSINRDILITINENNDIILVNMSYLPFVKFFNQIII